MADPISKAVGEVMKTLWGPEDKAPQQLIDASERRRGPSVRFMKRDKASSLTQEQLLLGYEKFPWLRMVIDKISELAGDVDWHIMVEDGKAEDGTPRLKRRNGHPLEKMLHRGNGLMPGLVLRELTFKYLLVAGEAFWMIERDTRGQPLELWPIPPHWVKEIPNINENGNYVIEINDFNAEIRPEAIVHIYTPSLHMPFTRGSSPGMTLADELQTDEFASKVGQQYFLNGARPDMIIMSDDEDNPFDDTDVKRMEQTWLNKLQGFWKTWTPFFVPGRVKVQTMGVDLKNTGLKEIREFSRDAVLQMYGLPPESLGLLENSNKSTIEGAKIFLWESVVVPKLKFMQASIQHHLVPEYANNNKLHVKFRSPLEGDKQHKLRVATRFPHAFTVDEIRTMADEPVIGGDEGKMRAVAVNMRFVSDLSDLDGLTVLPDGDTPNPDEPAGGGDGNTPSGDDRPDDGEND